MPKNKGAVYTKTVPKMKKGDHMQKSCQTFNLENFKNSEKRPFITATAKRVPRGGVFRGYKSRVGLTQKNFFLQKIACFGRKSRIGRFLKREKLPKIYPTTD